MNKYYNFNDPKTNLNYRVWERNKDFARAVIVIQILEDQYPNLIKGDFSTFEFENKALEIESRLILI